MTERKVTSFRLTVLASRQLAELTAALEMNNSEIVSTAIDRMYQQEIKTMTTKLAYQVSYVTEYRDGRIETNNAHTRFFATRDNAVAHAKYLTDADVENNGVFVGEWVTRFASMLVPEDQEEMRVTATVETVTLDEILAVVDAE